MGCASSRRACRRATTVVVNGLQHVRPGIKVAASLVPMDADRVGLEQVAAGSAHLAASRCIEALAERLPRPQPRPLDGLLVRGGSRPR